MKIVKLTEKEFKTILEDKLKEFQGLTAMNVSYPLPNEFNDFGYSFEEGNIINEKYPPETREELDIKNDMEDDFVEIMKNVIEKKDPKYPGDIVYADKNNEVYMMHDKENNKLWVDYYKLWSSFQSKYHLEYEENQRFFKDMMSEHYNLWDITPWATDFDDDDSYMSEHYNL